MILCSGVAVFVARGVQSQLSPLTETANILENNYDHVIEFQFICLTDLKSVEREIPIFNLKYVFCRPLDCAARGGSTTIP